METTTIIKIIVEEFETGLMDTPVEHWFETNMSERKIENVIYDARYKHKDRTKIDFLKRTFKYLGEKPHTYTFTINEDREYLESLKHGKKI